MDERNGSAGNAFSKQAAHFDGLDERNKLAGHLRSVYRREIMREAKPSARILELNCGTGIDSLYFAEHGYQVCAIDIADGMIDRLKEKMSQQHIDNNLSVRQCSYEELYRLEDQRFDYIVSNFGGLNCTGDLRGVLGQFKDHLNEGGKVTLVIMPKVSLWELLMAVKGKFRTALRRFKRRPEAHIEGVYFPVYYYSPSYVIRALKRDFKLIGLRGIYFAVPPEFYAGFVERYPRSYRFLQYVESVLGNRFPFNRWCDHYIVTFQKKSES